MFEVGKLSDESLDSFLIELEKVRAPGGTAALFLLPVVPALIICPLCVCVWGLWNIPALAVYPI